MDIVLKKKIISRRQFLALGCAASSGAFWINKSDASPARFLRQHVGNAGRAVPKARFRPKPVSWETNAVTLSWLGHSTVLINFYGLNILTDPVLFPRVGAHFGFGTIGPKRLIAPALTAREIPRLDLVLLSHAHMDHLDIPTLRSIPRPANVVTARATADLLSNGLFPRVSELGWGESTTVKTGQGDVRIQAFEVKHWGARWRRDTYRGYNGYLLEREGRKILFGGDTAFSSTFADLRGRGPFDIAVMPIGAYEPWICSHCTPEQAVSMADAAAARYFVPIHHGTFPLGKEGPVQPLYRLEDALDKERERLALRHVGETFSIG